MTQMLFPILYGPAQPFVWHPERALLMAAGFAMLLAISVWRSRKLKPGTHLLMLVAVLLWIAFGWREIQAKQAGWNIRVDLLLFWPALFVISIASAWLGICSIVMRKSTAGITNKMPDDPSLRADPRP